MDDSSKKLPFSEHSSEGPPSLRELADDLDGDGPGLDRIFAGLTERFDRIVGSLVAVTLTIAVDGYPFTVTSPRLSTDDIVTTVCLPFAVSESTTCSVVLGAAGAGAFSTLAHDAASELGVAAGIEHDRHFDAFETGSDSNLSERSTVDHAVGILLDRGGHDSVDGARAELADRAHRSARSLECAASDVVDEVTLRSVPDGPTEPRGFHPEQ